MNICIFTGWLPDDLELRITPAGNEAGTFRFVIDPEGQEGDEVNERISIYDAGLLARVRPLLTKGRAATVHCRRTVIRIHKAGGDTYLNAFVAVDIKIAERSDPKKPAVVPALKEAAA